MLRMAGGGEGKDALGLGPARKGVNPPATPAETQRVVPPTIALTNPSGAAPMVTSAANENSVDNIARVTEITRNIYRQANAKGVLFAAVNNVGRHRGASHCVEGLCTAGKPSSAALAECAAAVT